MTQKQQVLLTPNKTYNKPHLPIPSQVQLLISRGLSVPDLQTAVDTLTFVSYYRLSAYMLPFKQRDSSGEIQDVFVQGTTFDQVCNLYYFDKELRLLVFSALEKIEVAVRTQIIYQLSAKYGSHWTDNKAIFQGSHTVTKKDGSTVTIDIFTDLQKHLAGLRAHSQAEEFLRHYYATYATPANPPVWMSVETMYFSQLLSICQNLADQREGNAIASMFGLSAKVFYSWLLALNNMRNICAHHARLWNRDFTIVPNKLNNPRLPWISNVGTVQSRKSYYMFCIIQYFLQTIDPMFDFRKKLENLFALHPEVDIAHMGFPSAWEKENIWK